MRTDSEVEERIAIFETALDFEGIVVIDNSFLGTLGFWKDSEREDFNLKVERMQKELQLNHRILELVSHNDRIVFSEETRKEYGYFTERVFAPELEFIKEIIRKRRNKCHGLSSPALPAIEQLRHTIPVFLNQRRELLSSIGTLESRTPEIGNSYFEQIIEAVSDISYYVLLYDPLRTEKRLSKGIPEFEANDEFILAKCFAASYAEPVRLLASDSDFRGLWRGIYTYKKAFRERGVKVLPSHPVDLVTFFGNDLSRFYFDNFKQVSLAESTRRARVIS